MDMLEAASEGEKEASSPQEFADIFTKSKKQFEEIVQTTSVMIAEEVAHTHIAVAGQQADSFVALAGKNYINDCEDFMPYYCAMKGLLLEFWKC
jgi:hypothetical protein